MPAHRIVYRLDYEPCFAIIDKPGSILDSISKITKQECKNATLDVSFDSPSNKIFGRGRSEEYLYILSVEPACIWADIQLLQGATLDKVTAHEAFKACVKSTAQIYEDFNMNKIVRLGCRFYYFDKVFSNRIQGQQIFRKALNDKITKAVNDKLGGIEDYGITFDGTHDDKLKYRYMFGPYLENEARKYIGEEFAEQIDEESEYNFVSDLDLYELNFSLGSKTFINWFKHVSARALSTLTDMQSLLATGLENRP